MLQLVGCNHRSDDSELRERLAVPTSRLPEALQIFRDRFPRSEAVLLSTCNRTELYTAAVDLQHLPSNRELASFLAELNGIDRARIFDLLFHTTGEDAVRHLFTVAASLDSMVVGESQILGQVKHAYELASAGAHTGALTHAAFQAAIRVAKRIDRETSIHKRRVSLASVAIRELAKQVFERFDDKHILVIGAGDTATEALRCLCDEGATQFTVVNRDPRRAESVAKQFGGTAAEFESLPQLLAAADFVISATAAPGHIVSADSYAEVAPRRYQKPQFILDLAVPRDFAPEVADCLGVYLYTIDDLRSVCDRNRRQREGELPVAHQIIESETEQFMQDLLHRSTAPTIRRLRDQAQQVKAAEMDRLFRRMSELTDAQEAEIAQSFDRLVNKMLHPPLESLKAEPSDGDRATLLEAVRRLFKLGE